MFPLRVVRVESVIGVAPGGPHCRGVSRPSLGVPGGARCLIFSWGHHYRCCPCCSVADLADLCTGEPGLPGVLRCGAFHPRCGATGLPQVAFWTFSGGDFLLSLPGGPPINFTSFRWEYMNRRNDVRNIGGPPGSERKKSPPEGLQKATGGSPVAPHRG